MLRRDFSTSALATTALISAGLPLAAQAQGKPPTEGQDYLTLDKPAALESGADKVEVVEFFWYSCPHCNAFEPQLEAWVKKLPKDVAFRRVPVSFRADFEPQQRLYFVLEAMGKLDELHKKVFYSIHVDKQLLNTPELVSAWAEKNGLNKAKFTELYNSFAVSTKVRKAIQLQDQYKVDGVPSMGVAGRYFTSGSQAGTMERVLVVVDYLVAQQRKSATAAPAKPAKAAK